MILIGCEESQTICAAFRKAGYEAFSCDIEDTRGNPEWHYKDDVLNIIPTRQWDLIILHPPCTALSLSGNSHYGNGRPRNQERLDAIEWTKNLWELAKAHAKAAALENPTSVIFKHLKSPTFYLQPYEHGHGECKKTGFALYNLPPLTPTNPVEGREQRIYSMGPSATRKRDRSVTYQGVADAIVQQWAPAII